MFPKLHFSALLRSVQNHAHSQPSCLVRVSSQPPSLLSFHSAYSVLWNVATPKHDTHFQRALETNMISAFDFIKGEAYQRCNFTVSVACLEEYNNFKNLKSQQKAKQTIKQTKDWKIV